MKSIDLFLKWFDVQRYDRLGR